MRHYIDDILLGLVLALTIANLAVGLRTLVRLHHRITALEEAASRGYTIEWLTTTHFRLKETTP